MTTPQRRRDQGVRLHLAERIALAPEALQRDGQEEVALAGARGSLSGMCQVVRPPVLEKRSCAAS